MFTECIKIIINIDYGISLMDYLCLIGQCTLVGRISPTVLHFLPVYLDAVTQPNTEPEDNSPPRDSNLEVLQKDYKRSELCQTAVMRKTSEDDVCLGS